MHVSALLLVLVSAEANWAPLLFTRSVPSESRGSAVQGRCLCTGLLCRRRLVPLALRALIPLPCLESGGRSSAKVPLCASGPGPYSLSAVAPLYSQQIPRPSSVKASKSKVLRALWRHVARCPSLGGHKRMEKKCSD